MKNISKHGVSMNEEYPSTLEEAFEVPMEGAILEAVLDRAMQEGAFRNLVYDKTKPCYCTWDLGAPLNTINLVFQLAHRASQFVFLHFPVRYG